MTDDASALVERVAQAIANAQGLASSIHPHHRHKARAALVEVAAAMGGEDALEFCASDLDAFGHPLGEPAHPTIRALAALAQEDRA